MLLTHQIWRENVDLLPKIAQMLVVVYATEQVMFNAKMGYTYKKKVFFPVELLKTVKCVA